jgi:predicted RNase H-like nuclease (RuvC/YqgF family)
MKYVLLVSVLVFGLVLVARTEAGPTPQQDVIRLDSRVSQLEQRLYTIENSLRTLEQQSRMSMGGVRGAAVTPEDIAALRSEIQTLQVRLMEDECGIAKLDERTLTPAARDARRKAVGNDPCRLNFELPLRPPSR